MKKVLVIKTKLLPYSETFIREQVSAYTTWSAVLVGEQYVADLALDGLSTRILPTNRTLSRALEYLGIPNIRHVAALGKESADLVHTHFGTEGVKFWPLARRLGLPLVVTLHGSDINIYRDWWERHGGRIGSKYPRRLLKLSKNPQVHFVAVSEAVRDTAISFGIPGSRVRVKPIGVDLRKYAPGGLPLARRRHRVLYVGRLVEKKGARYLIAAFGRVCAAIPTAELLIVGDGPLEAELKTLAGHLPIAFAGKMSSAQVRDQMHEARVVCLPSITAVNGDAEGLPTVIVEAQACGVPVVTSALGGAIEGMLPGESGYAVPAKDSAAMAEALIEILCNDDKAERMSGAARAFVERSFDIHRCTLALEDYYDEIVSM